MSAIGPAAERQRALVFVWGGIGNMVMALPMVAALRNSGTVKALGIVAQKSAMLELIDPSAFPLAVALDGTRFRGLPGAFRLAGLLRAFKPDIAVSSVSYPRRYGLLALIAGAGRRICEEGHSHWFCNEAVTTTGAHLTQRNMELLKSLRIATAGPDHSLLYRGDRSAALRAMGLAANPGIIGIFAGAGHASRQWPLERFVTLAMSLAEQYSVVIFADPTETGRAEDIAAAFGGRVQIFTGPLRQKLDALSACRLFISANTGLAHCAAALGVPTLELEGPTDPAVYGPLGNDVAVIRGNAPCAPCYRGGNNYGCRAAEPPCMADISVDRVVCEAQRLLSMRS